MSNFFNITKEKEGFEVPESAIPIDIQYQKLLDWLVDRKRIPTDWNKELQKLEKEIAIAKTLVQNNENIQPFLTGELWIGKVDKIVKEIEKTEKGWTGSKEGNGWRRVLKHLNWKYLFLAHSARLLLSLVNYEIPAVKKESDGLQKQITDAEKKIAEYTKSASDLKGQFERECNKMGIKGEDIIGELNELTSELPDHYQSISKQIQNNTNISQSIEFYKHFMINIHKIDKDLIVNVCPILSYVSEHGDDYLQIMEKRNKGEKITDNDYSKYNELKNKKNNVVEEVAAQPTINWDIDDDISTENNNINFDIAGNEEVHEIQWDIGVEESSGEASIQWDISVEDSGDQQATINWDDDTNSSITDNVNNNGIDDISLETILSCSHTRNQFIDDLLEIQGFLQQRLVEVENEKMAVLQYDHTLESMNNSAAILPLLQHITAVLDSFNNERFKLLIDIKSSKRYTERLANSLKQKIDLSKRAISAAAQSQTKLQQLEDHFTSMHPKIRSLVDDAKDIKLHTEAELSKLYSNRPVHLTGDIAKLLSL